MEDGDGILVKSFPDAFFFLKPYLKFSKSSWSNKFGVCSFNKHFLSICCKSGSVRGSGDTVINNDHPCS